MANLSWGSCRFLLRGVLLLMAVLLVSRSATAEPNNDIVGNLNNEQVQRQEDFREETRERIDAHRELGFFVNGGRSRRQRGRRSSRSRGRSQEFVEIVVVDPDEQGGSRRRSRGGPPYIDRDRDPLEEGGWERKRVDMIRASTTRPPTLQPSISGGTTNFTTPVSPTVSPSATTAPGPSTSAPTPVTTTAGPGGTTAAPSAGTTTAGPGGTTTAPSAGATTAGPGGTTTAPSAGTTTAGPGGTTTAPSAGASAAATPAASAADVTPGTTAVPTAAGGNATTPPGNGTAFDIMQRSADIIGRQRSYEYDMAMLRSNFVCKGGPQELKFGIEIKVNFPRRRFKACTGGQFEGLKSIIQTTLNMAFPELVTSWPESVRFHEFLFDVDQFALHVNPFPERNKNQRHLLRRDDANEAEEVGRDYDLMYGETLNKGSSAGRRRLQEERSLCPVKPTVCSGATDVCMYGCGIASIRECGDLSLWRNMGTALSLAVAAQSLECLGGQVPPIVNLMVLPS